VCGRQIPDAAGKRDYQGHVPLDLLFTNRRTGGKYGGRDVLDRVTRKWWSSLLLVKSGVRSAKLLPRTSRRWTLNYSRQGWGESLGNLF